MISDQDIRHNLALVAKGQLSLNEFEDWFVLESRNMHRDSSPDAINLAESIHSLLSERNDQILDDKSLKRELLQLLSDASHEVIYASVNSRPVVVQRFGSTPNSALRIAMARVQ